MKKTRLLVTVIFGIGLGFLTWYAISKGMSEVAGNGMTGVYLLGIGYAASQGYTKGRYLGAIQIDNTKPPEG